MKKILFSENVWWNSLIKGFFIALYFWRPWFPFVLKWFALFRPVIEGKGKKELVFAVTLGFLSATIRSCWKKIRAKDGKPNIDLLPTYLINYPIALGSIFTLGGYYCEVKNFPLYVSVVILFVLGFFVDGFFDAMKNVHKNILKIIS